MYKWKVYNQQDIIDALTELGHEVDSIQEKVDNYNEDTAFSEKLTSIILDNHYDCMLSVNYFGVVAEACQQAKIKYIVWTCDSPLITMHHETVFYECNYIFIFDKVNYYTFKQMGLKHVFYMPLAVNTNRIENLMTGANDLEKYCSDISFVGSMYRKNSYDDVEDKLPEYLRGYLKAAMLAQIDIFGEDLIKKLMTEDILYELGKYIDFEQSERSFSSLPLVFETTFLGFKMAQIERIHNLNLLAQHHQVDVYSDGEDSRLAGVTYRGSVNYHKDMPKVFNQSKINLNFTIRNIKSGIPLRAWDIMGSEGFLLTNFQAEIPQYFENGKDLVFYEDTDDLLRKADYYLIHEEERSAIAHNGFRKVQAEHSYKKRLEQMLLLIS